MTATHHITANLTEEQAAQKIGVKTKTLQAWRIRGVGPKYLKLGRSVRYRLVDLEDFEQKCLVSSTSETSK